MQYRLIVITRLSISDFSLIIIEDIKTTFLHQGFQLGANVLRRIPQPQHGIIKAESPYTATSVVFFAIRLVKDANPSQYRITFSSLIHNLTYHITINTWHKITTVGSFDYYADSLLSGQLSEAFTESNAANESRETQFQGVVTGDIATGLVS